MTLLGRVFHSLISISALIREYFSFHLSQSLTAVLQKLILLIKAAFSSKSLSCRLLATLKMAFFYKHFCKYPAWLFILCLLEIPHTFFQLIHHFLFFNVQTRCEGILLIVQRHPHFTNG